MKAIVRHAYGSPDVFRLEEVAKPTAGETDVLVRVHAASANAGDWHLMRGTPFPFRLVAGLLKPKHTIIGTDIAGRVEAVGRRVTQFKPGDDVFGELSRSGFGGYAEYVAAPETVLALKPSNASFEEAAATPTSGLTALQGLRKGKIGPGQKVLIHGAGGVWAPLPCSLPSRSAPRSPQYVVPGVCPWFDRLERTTCWITRETISLSQGRGTT